MATNRAQFHAPWSASKVNMALRCPREFHYRYVDKLPQPETMPETRLGKVIHTALEKILLGADQQVVLAELRVDLEDDWEKDKFDRITANIPAYLQRLNEFGRKHRINRRMTEFFLAIREDGTPTQFYSGDAFFRGIFDAGYIFDNVNMALIDHKTGERRKSSSMIAQLQGYAVLAAASFRQVRRFWLGMHWVANAVIDWSRPVSHSETQGELLPNVFDNIEAAALAVSDGPRPNPGTWCERCSYRSVCPAAWAVRFEPVDDETVEPGLED